ncbi:hypothetical protein SDC9_158950 [bioreactor metagenome]|uniref:Uncharacterized protein n=1 Tax=bioreactor metagenome TaxID=1076179 RepID=A0A645FDI3_9ZZZZ
MTPAGLLCPRRCLPDGNPRVVGIADLLSVGGRDGLLWCLRMEECCGAGVAFRPIKSRRCWVYCTRSGKVRRSSAKASCMTSKSMSWCPPYSVTISGAVASPYFFALSSSQSGKTPLVRHCRNSSIWHCKPCARVSRSLPGTRLYVSSSRAIARSHCSNRRRRKTGMSMG